MKIALGGWYDAIILMSLHFLFMLLDGMEENNSWDEKPLQLINSMIMFLCAEL